MAYLVANAMLLIPTRMPGMIGILALVTFLGVAYFEREHLSGDSSLRTKEGLLARGLLYMPVALMIGRSMNLYAIDGIFMSMLNVIAAVILFRYVPKAIEDRKSAVAIQGLSVLPAVSAHYHLANTIIGQFAISADLRIPLMFLPMSAILIGMSLYSFGTGSGYRKAGVLLGITSVIAELFFYPGTVSSFLCVFTGLLAVSYGYTVEEKATFALGLLGLGVGLGYHLKAALELATFSPWISLAVVGITTIIASSYIERNHRAIAQRLRMFKARMATWN